MAERLWSPKTVTDINSATSRIDEHRCRMVRWVQPVVGHFDSVILVYFELCSLLDSVFIQSNLHHIAGLYLGNSSTVNKEIS